MRRGAQPPEQGSEASKRRLALAEQAGPTLEQKEIEGRVDVALEDAQEFAEVGDGHEGEAGFITPERGMGQVSESKIGASGDGSAEHQTGCYIPGRIHRRGWLGHGPHSTGSRGIVFGRVRSQEDPEGIVLYSPLRREFPDCEMARRMAS